MENYRKYISSTPNPDPQLDWGISVLDVGHHIHAADTVYPDIQHPKNYFFQWAEGRVLKEYQLVYIAAGRGIFESDAIGEVEVLPGTLFFLYPGIWHRFKPDERTGWTEYWVGFGGHYADHLMKQKCFSPKQPLLHMGFNAEFISIFIQLIDTIKFGMPGSSQLAACLTVQLLGLVYASALLKTQSPSRKTQVINNIKYTIHENFDSDMPLEGLAANHNVSYAWFRKAFKEITGLSPGQYQLNLKIQKACRLLVETELSISEIAFRNGFDSEHYFSRAFKNKMLKSPSSYRKEYMSKISCND